MKTLIALIAEHSGGSLSPTFLELVEFGAKLKGATGFEPIVIILGQETGNVANEATSLTGLDTVAINVPGLFTYNSDAYKAVLGSVLGNMKPAYVCAIHSSTGSELAPPLSVRLNAACVTSVQEIKKQSDRLTFYRSVLGGKAQATFVSTSDVTVITVQPGSFKKARVASCSGSIEFIEFSHDFEKVVNLGIKPVQGTDSPLSHARVIVSGGKGLREKQNLDLLFDLARMFSKSAVGCTRPLCDAGWLRSGSQVGLSGATVSPDLYIACGVSGAHQHVIGMQGSGFVVAVNTDPNAPIFDHADVCVIEDAIKFTPELIKAISQYKKHF